MKITQKITSYLRIIVNINYGEHLRSFSLRAAGQAASACGADIRRKLGFPSVQFAMKQEAKGVSPVESLLIVTGEVSKC